jgi:type IV pilus assembly protein PilM
VVRFRLKKLLPFDADDAAVSYQVMATAKGSVQVLAVAMPRELLADYESVVREAGFEPGAVLPSTLAALAGLPEGRGASMLVVNAGRSGSDHGNREGRGPCCLHRTVDLGADRRADASEPPPRNSQAALLRSRWSTASESAEEWAASGARRL